MTPALSIVMPALDEAAGIAAALHALAGARAEGAEVIVVDGGSRDATVSLSERCADRVITASRGRARQMNAGAAVARAPVLLFLHADTALPAGGARAALDAVNAGAAWGRFDVRIEGRSAMLPVIAAFMNARSRLTGIATGDQALFVRADRFAEAGGFPDQPLMEDVELSSRLKRFGAPACLHERVATSGRRWEQRGVWRTVWLMWRLRLRYWLGTPADRLAEAYR